jgi:MFS family permease
MSEAFSALFTPAYKRRTIVNSGLFLVSIIGLWAGSIYVPTAVTQIAIREGRSAAEAARMASYGSGVLAIGTIIGCLAAPWLAEKMGRRLAMATYFAIMVVGVMIGFGYVFYQPASLMTFFALNLRDGSRRCELRALHALAAGAVQHRMPRQRDCVRQLHRPLRRRRDGVPRRRRHSRIRKPRRARRLTALAFIAGLALLPAAEETRGKALPA